MELRQIRQFSRLGGTNRNPNVTEHNKVPMWDNNAGYHIYTALVANSNTADGIVKKGSEAAAASYIWKLDGSKVPDWRKEEFLVSAAKDGGSNAAIFTMNNGSTISLPLGALAWDSDTIPTIPIDSVFGRTGHVVAVSGDYTAAEVTNAFDKVNNNLSNILEGGGVYHLTTAYKAFIDTGISVGLDNITSIGSGDIITTAERNLLNSLGSGNEELIRDTVAAFIQNGTGITWVHDDPGNTLTPTVSLSSFTTADLSDSNDRRYVTEAEKALLNTLSGGGIVWPIILNSSTTVAGRLVGLIEGTDYPTGWTLVAGTQPEDLLITHNKGKKLNTIKIYSVDPSTSAERLLIDFNTAFGGVLVPDSNSILVEALSLIETKLKIYITFV